MWRRSWKSVIFPVPLNEGLNWSITAFASILVSEGESLCCSRIVLAVPLGEDQGFQLLFYLEDNRDFLCYIELDIL